MRHAARRSPPKGKPGRVIANVGRRVVVRDDEGERVCFLSGQRAVVGDHVRWVDAQGSGGKLVGVEPRERALVRMDFKGRTQVVASHLGGLLVVASTDQPFYRPGLMDRYEVGASVAGIDMAIVLTKTDLGIHDLAKRDLAAREERGIPIMRVCNHDGDGVDEVRSFLKTATEGPWAFVGHSGVGKTSLAAALLPEVDVGPIGAISEFWEAGRHTTTSSRIYRLPTGGEIADSPGIRTFLPSGLNPHAVRDHFPGLDVRGCRYRDCLHREGEDGCAAEAESTPELLLRYRRLLVEVTDLTARMRR